jgi:transposase
MGPRTVAADPKKGVEEHAHLVLIDETGMFLNPLVRRSWAKKGQTPILAAWSGRRDKVNVIGALSLSPVTRRCGLYFATNTTEFFNDERVVGFLRHLLRHLRGKVIVIWDGGPNHKGPMIEGFLRRNRRLWVERLPPYAPDLNPIEVVWSWLKYGKLSNGVPDDVNELENWTHENLVPLKRNAELLRSMWNGSELPFPTGINTQP